MTVCRHSQKNMMLISSLTSLFGKTIAEGLIKAFTTRKNGQAKLEAAADAMAKGASAIEALRKAFGKEFLPTLNELLASNSRAPFEYEAGVQGYITMDEGMPLSVRILRDELNVNLDRLAVKAGDQQVLVNQFRGVFKKWTERCLEVANALGTVGVKEILAGIDRLLSGEARNYRQVMEILARTALGSSGALMVIAGAFFAASTGVGLFAALTATLFGIPWITVGSLAIPGLLMVFLAKRGVGPRNELSLAVSAAYQLLALMEKVNEEQRNRKEIK